MLVNHAAPWHMGLLWLENPSDNLTLDDFPTVNCIGIRMFARHLWWRGRVFWVGHQQKFQTHMLHVWNITNICPKNHPNVGKYTMHGAYMGNKLDQRYFSSTFLLQFLSTACKWRIFFLRGAIEFWRSRKYTYVPGWWFQSIFHVDVYIFPYTIWLVVQ